MNKSKRKKQDQTKRRLEAIKDLMSTFAMSTVAVVAVVTLIPASPKAEIVRAVPLTEEVAYNVLITDEENALDLSTLFVVLENQLEYYETPLILGENTGYFEGLTANTEYRLSIYGSKGFGQERLDTIKITTKETVGATILNVSQLEDIESSYLVDVSVYDPDSTYSEINLYYGYSFEPDQEIQYQRILITSDRMEVVLSDIFTSDSFHVYIEGIKDGEAILLDELIITPRYEFNAYVYLSTITNHSITLSIYGDTSLDSVRYQIDFIQNNITVKTVTYIPPNSEDHHSEGYTIEGLDKASTYQIIITAIYQDPNTLREEKQEILTEEITTLDDYEINYQSNMVDNQYEITITIDDPNDYFHIVYYEVYDTTGEFDNYIEGMVIPLEIIDGSKIKTFFITIPDVESYYITINIQNQDDFSINEVIDKIEVN